MKKSACFSAVNYLALMLLLLSGCTIPEPESVSEASSVVPAAGTALKSGSFSVSGHISEKLPATEAKIELRTFSGKVLASGPIAADGSFELTSSVVPEPGYTLKADIGYENISLQAIYSVNKRDQANLTPLTLLVDKLSEQYTDDSLTKLQRRDKALKVLHDMGVVSTGEWYKLAPQDVEWTEVRERIEALGLDNWIQTFVKMLNEGEISAAMMSGLPATHGGLLSVSLGDVRNVLEVTAGSEYKIPVITKRYRGDENYTVELINPIENARVEGYGRQKYIYYQAPTSLTTEDELSFQIKVENEDTGKKGRVFSVPVKPIKKDEEKTIVTKKISAVAGQVTDSYSGLIAAIMALTSDPFDLSIARTVKENDRIFYRGVLNAEEKRETVDRLGEMLLPPYRTMLPHAANGRLPYSLTDTIDHDRPIKKIWYSYYASMQNDEYGGTFVNRLATGKGCPIVRAAATECFWQPAAVLETHCALGKNCAGLTPVLLVNGYERNQLGAASPLGGGQKVWGTLPDLLEEKQYAVYEFRWRTNTSLPEIARELAEAIDIISKQTGKKTHIVAHNIGGIVARLYLQNLAGHIKDDFMHSRLDGTQTHIAEAHTGYAAPPAYRYADNVQSLVTLGTDYTNLLYEDLRHCKQVFCAQMGYLYADNILSPYQEDTEKSMIQKLLRYISTEDVRYINDFFDLFRYYEGYKDILSLDEINNRNEEMPVDVLALMYLDDVAINSPYFKTFTTGSNNFYYGQRFYFSDEFSSDINEDPCFTREERKVCEKILSADNRISTPFGEKLLSYLNDWLTESDDSPAAEKKIDIEMQVKDIVTGLPVADADIVADVSYRVLGSSATDSKGHATLSASFYPHTVYHVTVKAPGYIPYRFDNRYTSGGTVETSDRRFGEIRLTPQGTPATGVIDMSSVTDKDDLDYKFLAKDNVLLYRVSASTSSVKDLVPGQYQIIQFSQLSDRSGAYLNLIDSDDTISSYGRIALQSVDVLSGNNAGSR